MTVTGQQFINGEWVKGDAGFFNGVNPANGQNLTPAISRASRAQVDIALQSAARAAPILAASNLAQRAQFLRACAEEITEMRQQIVERVTAETGYPQGRGESELARTCGQLRLFADYIMSGDYLDARVDTAQPGRTPLPRPDIRQFNQALGPVVVFGASNFPLAFSVAGGDTASALAAGCPVLVKGHPSHPGTGELVAQAVARAVEKCQLPSGTFSFLIDSGFDVGAQLVTAPQVKAVGFTGSYQGGTALMKLAQSRPDPIPVFAEMGSINPVVLMPGALANRAGEIAQNFVASLTLGNGQFCVNPGLVIALDNVHLQTFIKTAQTALGNIAPGVMLNQRICETYIAARDHLSNFAGVELVASGSVGASTGNGSFAGPALLLTSAAHFLQNPQLQEEIFGPASLVVKCSDMTELLKVVAELKGQLTATLHGDQAELIQNRQLCDALTEKVGRVVINGFPTGVEVCHAMVHGGPFPATSDSRFTSVGTNAIKRFIRPVCYQNFPDELLPPALQNQNPLGITRLVDGERHNRPLAQ